MKKPLYPWRRTVHGDGIEYTTFYMLTFYLSGLSLAGFFYVSFSGWIWNCDQTIVVPFESKLFVTFSQSQ